MPQDIVTADIMQSDGRLRRVIDNGDGTYSELTVSKSTAGPPSGGQKGISLSGTGSFTTTPGTTTVTNVNPNGVAGAYTPTNKLFVTDINFTANTAQIFEVQILSAAVIVFRGYCKGDTGPIQLMGIETQPFCPANAAVTFAIVTAGTVVATNFDWFVAGYEQNN